MASEGAEAPAADRTADDRLRGLWTDARGIECEEFQQLRREMWSNFLRNDV
jgi:hypothetical protein